jgi:hypothetical protein
MNTKHVVWAQQCFSSSIKRLKMFECVLLNNVKETINGYNLLSKRGSLWQMQKLKLSIFSGRKRNMEILPEGKNILFQQLCNLIT